MLFVTVPAFETKPWYKSCMNAKRWLARSCRFPTQYYGRLNNIKRNNTDSIFYYCPTTPCCQAM